MKRMIGLLGAAVCVVVSVQPSHTQSVPQGFSAANFQVVGYSEIDGRPGFKMAIREVNGRWYMYMGHLWHRGWSILDVTDPAKPQVLKFVAGPENTWTIQMDLHDDIMITGMAVMRVGWLGHVSNVLIACGCGDDSS